MCLSYSGILSLPPCIVCMTCTFSLATLIFQPSFNANVICLFHDSRICVKLILPWEKIESEREWKKVYTNDENEKKEELFRKLTWLPKFAHKKCASYQTRATMGDGCRMAGACIEKMCVKAEWQLNLCLSKKKSREKRTRAFFFLGGCRNTWIYRKMLCRVVSRRKVNWRKIPTKLTCT